MRNEITRHLKIVVGSSGGLAVTRICPLGLLQFQTDYC
jgi:hypothetical protein